MSQPPIRDETAQGLARYLRRPDTAFWFGLLRPSPPSTQADRQRRFRVARYALGIAGLLALFYGLLTLVVAGLALPWLVIVNLLAAACLGLGMWMASLGRSQLARGLLMATVSAQVTILLWLTGSALMMVAFAPALAALARVVFAHEENGQRVFYVALGMLLFCVGLTLDLPPKVDLSVLPGWMLSLVRGGNALVSVLGIMLIIVTYDKQVLHSEVGLEQEQERSDRLLEAVLPADIASRLRTRPGAIAERHAEASVLFADIAGFTPWSAGRPAEEVVAMLETIFSRFDRCVLARGVEKIKTIGDAYMVVAGAPTACDDHAARLAQLALDLLAELEAVREETGIAIRLRVGLHSGPLIAGVIGVMRFTYDIWGDSVNTASRMESHGEPGRIQISDATRQLLGEAFRVERRGRIAVKGKGEMETWWLLGRRAEA